MPQTPYYEVFGEAQNDQLYRRLLRDREKWHMLFYDYQDDSLFRHIYLTLLKIWHVQF